MQKKEILSPTLEEGKERSSPKARPHLMLSSSRVPSSIALNFPTVNSGIEQIRILLRTSAYHEFDKMTLRYDHENVVRFSQTRRHQWSLHIS